VLAGIRVVGRSSQAGKKCRDCCFTRNAIAFAECAVVEGLVRLVHLQATVIARVAAVGYLELLEKLRIAAVIEVRVENFDR